MIASAKSSKLLMPFSFRAAKNYEDGDKIYKDAIFLSPHKFIGGPETPGVLIVKKALLQNRVPTVPGGGTVSFVSFGEHLYVKDPIRREEGGTPSIIGAIRCGMVFQLKEAVGSDLIREKEETFTRRAIASWEKNPNLEILGSHEHERLCIVSFVVRHGSRYLHHNFVVALLNDLFGIQSRGGCSCAGPYGHRLLGIDLDTSHEFEREIGRGCEGIKPGWVRVNFNYFITEEGCDFILDAVHLVATHGWKLLNEYGFDPATGLWQHRQGIADPPLSLWDVDVRAGGFAYADRRRQEPRSRMQEYLEEARQTFEAAAPGAEKARLPEVTRDFEHLRWFPLPGEAEEGGPTRA